MTHPYNIHPLALSPQHYLLARAGFVVAPLWEVDTVESLNAGHFVAAADQHGEFIGPTIVVAGHFQVDPALSGQDYTDKPSVGLWNIHPLALSAQHYLLAQAGFILSPLREAGQSVRAGHFKADAEIDGRGQLNAAVAGHFRVGADIYGQPDEDVQVVAGHFEVGAELQAATYEHIIAIAGHFSADTSVPQPGVAMSVPCRFSMDTTVHGVTYIGMFADVGHFESSGELSASTDQYIWWLSEQPASAQLIYTCVLTGAENGLDDLVLPMSTVQYRMYDTGRTYLSITVPDPSTYADAAIARKDGQMIIRRGYKYVDGSSVASEIARAGRIQTRYDNETLTVTAGGAVTFSFDPAVTKTSREISRRRLHNGKMLIKIDPLNGLYPGDSLTVGDSAYAVERIDAKIGRGVHEMEIMTDG